MLQQIRERAQGWIAWAIIALISIPFALWGIQSYLGVGSQPVAAAVNGVEITQRELDLRSQETRMRLRERLGASYRPELFDEQTMRAQVLDRMIQDNLLLQVAHGIGLRASNQELRTAIMTNPAFQKEGRFDNATYERMLELQGMRPPQYEDSLRQRIVGTQLQRAVLASELATPKEVEDAVRLDRQERRVSFVRVPKSEVASDGPLEDAEIQTYYEAHQERFQTPERVKLSYLLLDANSLDSSQSADADALRQRYQEEKARFTEPEKRRARHILITLDPGADAEAEAAAKARVEELRARIEAGEDFAELAKTQSQDPGSAGQGGDLGLFQQGVMDPAFDKAVFALAQGELSAPVRSQFGYHLIRVDEIEPERVKPFEEVREQLAAEVAKSNSEGLFFDWAERLANLTYENPDSLQPAADALGLKVETSDWVTRTGGGTGILANPKVIAAAFSDDVLKEGRNSELIEPERNVLQAVVLRSIEHEEAAVKPLDQVRDEIVGILRGERAAAAAKTAAEAMVERLKAGEALAAVAGERPVTELGLVGRNAPGVPPGVRTLAFTLPTPAAGAASYGIDTLADGDSVVVAVTEVTDGVVDQLNEAQRTQARTELERATGNAYYDALVEDLQTRAKIERKPIAESPSL
jgi:peptidyl-prolyl cis-trans isomerase D